MKIQQITDNGDGAVNEDVLLINDPVFVVADGATSKNRFFDNDGRTGGLIASTIACNAFKDDNSSLVNTAKKANEELLRAMQTAKIDTSDPRNVWKASFVAIKVGKEDIEWLQVGDCSILVIMEDGTHYELGNTIDYDAAPLLVWKKIADSGVQDIGAEFSRTYRDARDILNTKLSVMNGDPRMNDLVESGLISKRGISDIIMFTDGLDIPKTQPDQPSDLNMFIKLYGKGGLAEIMKHTRAQEKTDPDCRQFPRFKQHDDIAAISITF